MVSCLKCNSAPSAKIRKLFVNTLLKSFQVLHVILWYLFHLKSEKSQHNSRKINQKARICEYYDHFWVFKLLLQNFCALFNKKVPYKLSIWHQNYHRIKVRSKTVRRLSFAHLYVTNKISIDMRLNSYCKHF
jgi:hypothetical protein